MGAMDLLLMKLASWI